MIEATYSKYVVDHADALVRAALLESEPSSPGDNVRPFRGR
jgi:hypothetical protein